MLHTITDHSANVNAGMKYDETALMTAYVNGDVDAIDVLREAGANPNIMDDDGDACLHNAAEISCSIKDLQSFTDRLR